MDIKELRQFAGDEVVQDEFDDLYKALETKTARIRTLGAEAAKPIDMLIFCPACNFQHIDEAKPDVCETCGGSEAECKCPAFTACQSSAQITPVR